MSRKRVSRRNPFSVRYSTDLVLAISTVMAAWKNSLKNGCKHCSLI